MMFSNVNIVFRGVNLVTPVINSISRSIGNIGKQSQGLSSAGAFMANFGAGLALKGVDLAAQGYQNLANSMQGVMKEQTSFITNSSALATALEVPMGKAKGLMDTIQTELSTAAAILPGENRDYIGVLNMISDTVAGQFKGDIEGFKTAVLDISKRTAALASTVPGLSGDAAGQTMEMLIAGNTMTSLKRLDLFQKNAPLRNSLEQQIKAAGLEGDKWTKATTKQRLEVIQKALKVAATDELFAEFENTAESIMQAMKNKLFDTRTGIFGLMRKVDNREDRTVLDSFTEVLKRIRTLGAAGNRIAKALGLASDPMAGLIDLFDGINNFLGNITYQLDISTPDMGVENVVKYIGDWFGGLFKSALPAIKGLDSGFIGKAVSMVGTFVQSIDWLSVGRFLGNAVWKIFIALVRSIPDLAVLGGKLANGAVSLATGLVLGIIEGVGVSLYNLFVKPIVDFFTRIRSWWTKLRASMPNLSGVSNAVQAVTNVVTNPVGAAIDLGKKVLGIGDNKDKPAATTTGNPTADKVNANNKVTPVKPVAPANTVQKVASNSTQSNTIQGLTINAANAGTPQEIASVVIEELNRQLNFKVAQQLA